MNMAQLEVKHNLFTSINAEEKNTTYYDSHMTIVIARLIQFFNDMSFIQQAFSFGQQYMLQKGLKVFGQRGYDAAEAEIHQLHDRVCFKPVSVATMTAEEKRKAMEALMFLTEKRPDLEGNTKVKGRMVYNGKPTREWLSREDSASPTVSTESLFLTAVIEAVEERDVMTADIPNAFIQAPMPEVREGEPRVMMKITGVLVDMLVSIDADLYGPFIVFDRGRKVLYVQVLLAIYGQLVASLRWFLTFSKDLEGIGFEFNPYDPCVANRMVNGSQQTILFHVDDLKSSHVDPAVNDEFAEWLQGKYGKHKKLEPQRGKQHEYLGMILDYTEKGKVKIDMRRYVADMIEDFPVKLRESDKSAYPASEDLFGQHQEDDTMLSKTMAEGYHSTVAKGLFLSKRSRPDIQPSIAYLSTRVKAPTQTDWKKLVKMMKFLNATREDVLTLGAENLHVIKWYVDASFAVHEDYKSHTGAVMTFGHGAVQSLSRKQKLNTKSSTEAELVAVDDAAVMILWTKLFMEAQGYHIEKNILYQDNKSAILLETNGRKSAGRRSRALNVRYFFVTDQKEKGNINIEFCPTKEMRGDYMTKALTGEPFGGHRQYIMGIK